MILIGGVLLLALIFWLIPFINQKRDSLQKEEQQGMLKITVDGKQYGTYSLSKNRTIEINDTNICEIKNGQAHMTEATCPDHLCMKQHAIDSKGGTIVCLPNKVVIEGTKASAGAQSDDGLSIDAVT